MLVVIDDEVERLARALGRTIAIVDGGIVQRCVVCDTDLVSPGTTIREDRDQLHRRLFELYDDHRCDREVSMAYATDGGLDELYERTEAASVQMAERASAHDLEGDLRARIERESETLAIWAARLSVLKSPPADPPPRPSMLSIPIVDDELVDTAPVRLGAADGEALRGSR